MTEEQRLQITMLGAVLLIVGVENKPEDMQLAMTLINENIFLTAELKNRNIQTVMQVSRNPEAWMQDFPEFAKLLALKNKKEKDKE